MITKTKICKLAKGIAKYMAKDAVKQGDNTNYLGYQLPVIDQLMTHNLNAFKMPRQVGKTWTASFIAVAYLLAGIDVLVAYPTLDQGWKLLLSKIANICRFLGIRLVRANSKGIECANGAKVHVVTTNKLVESNRGYTAGLLIIDEAQNVDVKAMAALVPSVQKYFNMNLSTVIFMGTGGYRGKLLETSWRERGYNLVHITPQDIIAVDPSYEAVDEANKLSLGPHGYSVEIDCQCIEGGNSSIFKHLDTKLPKHLENNINYIDGVGIDIGHNPDNTVITHLRCHLGANMHLEVLETMRLDDTYDIQCPKLKQWIYDRNLQRCNISVETNGVGLPIYHFLNRKDVSDTDPMINIYPFHIGKNKKGIIMKLQEFDYAKHLIITDDDMRNALMGLSETHTADGKITYDHSDYASSLIAATAHIIQ